MSEKASARKRDERESAEKGGRGQRKREQERERESERARERERERGRKCISEIEIDLLEQNVQANVGDESFTT